MPYIKKEQRDELQDELISLLKEMKFEEGEMNYIITFLLHEFVIQNGLCYKTLNSAVGILECSKEEFVRRVVSPYEDLKIMQNGSISELDKEKL